MLMAGKTLPATPAPNRERNRHPFAGFPPPHLGPDLLHNPGKLMAGHVRQTHVAIVPHPTVPIAATDSSCLDPDHHPIARRLRVWRLSNDERPIKLLKDDGSHEWSTLSGANPQGKDREPRKSHAKAAFRDRL
jgi:hypothetical protein